MDDKKLTIPDNLAVYWDMAEGSDRSVLTLLDRKATYKMPQFMAWKLETGPPRHWRDIGTDEIKTGLKLAHWKRRIRRNGKRADKMRMKEYSRFWVDGHIGGLVGAFE